MNLSILGLLVVIVASCNASPGDKSSEGAPEKIEESNKSKKSSGKNDAKNAFSLFPRAYALVADAGDCEEDREGLLVYSKEDRSFYVCEAGSWGIIDLRGPKGDKGDKGEVGLNGAPGLKGDKGDTGDVGPKGDTGAQGIQGTVGATGPAGSTGATGPQGLTGESGSKVGQKLFANDDTEIGVITDIYVSAPFGLLDPYYVYYEVENNSKKTFYRASQRRFTSASETAFSIVPDSQSLTSKTLQRWTPEYSMGRKFLYPSPGCGGTETIYNSVSWGDFGQLGYVWYYDNSNDMEVDCSDITGVSGTIYFRSTPTGFCDSQSASASGCAFTIVTQHFPSILSAGWYIAP